MSGYDKMKVKIKDEGKEIITDLSSVTKKLEESEKEL